MLIVPDEEVGGIRGMKLLLGHSFFRDVNPGVVIDEGLASTDSKYSVFYAEVRAAGWPPVRHGALMHFLQTLLAEEDLVDSCTRDGSCRARFAVRPGYGGREAHAHGK